MRSLLFVYAFLLAAAALTSATGGYGSPKLGAWKPIKNLADPLVQKIARFAVAENNKKVNAALKLSRVVSGELIVFTGVKYRLIIDVESDAAASAASAGGGGGGLGKYEAVVLDKPWKKYRELISFQKVK